MGLPAPSGHRAPARSSTTRCRRSRGSAWPIASVACRTLAEKCEPARRQHLRKGSRPIHARIGEAPAAGIPTSQCFPSTQPTNTSARLGPPLSTASPMPAAHAKPRSAGRNRARNSTGSSCMRSSAHRRKGATPPVPHERKNTICRQAYAAFLIRMSATWWPASGNWSCATIQSKHRLARSSHRSASAPPTPGTVASAARLCVVRINCCSMTCPLTAGRQVPSAAPARSAQSRASASGPRACRLVFPSAVSTSTALS